LIELAARTAALAADGLRRAPGSQAAADAIAARAVFDATASDGLEYFGPVAATPGFPRALSRTIHELRLAAVEGDRLATLGAAGRDLRRLLERFEGELNRASIADRAQLFRLAADAWRARPADGGVPVGLLGITVDSRAEREFVA